MTCLMWFRTDLRLADNPAFSAAMACGPTLAVYCITEQSWDEHQLSPARRALMAASLRELATGLERLNVPLLVVNCRHFSKIPTVLSTLCKQHHIQQLFFNHEYEYNERQCTSKVVRSAEKSGVAVRGYHDQCALTPGTIKTGGGDWYRVFTPFKNKYLSEYDRHARALVKKPGKQKPVALSADLAALEKWPTDSHWLKLWPGGEQEATRRLKKFLDGPLQDYSNWRDFPAVDGTSSLSPYLAVGCISSRQCMDAAWHLGAASADDNAGAHTWLVELVWRDFYRHLLFAYPKLCMHQPFIDNTDQLPWRTGKALFDTWAEGRTGYPIVDAAIHQLRSTGWMHNRLRMVTAMFLTKHLFIDWRMGEAFFMQHLVDGDLASNNGGWQWSASTGVDAAPYFRIFNPVRQSQRFDPKGIFIRRYLPQLASLDNRAIHMPTAEQARARGYPTPVVDHREATEQTKSWFKALK